MEMVKWMGMGTDRRTSSLFQSISSNSLITFLFYSLISPDAKLTYLGDNKESIL